MEFRPRVAMLLRLLVAVLTLVGPMPFRVCTCAAGHAEHAPGAADPHHGAHSDPADAQAGECEAPAAGCSGAAELPEHDRDCPALGVRPVARDGAPPSPTPAGCGLFPILIRTEAASVPAAHLAAAPGPDRAPKLPLYLAHCALRN